MPNVLAGILIGFANQSWTAVGGAAVGWAVVFCIFVEIADRDRAGRTIAEFRERGQTLLFDSPVLTFYSIEFATALSTALPIAAITFGAKQLAT